MSDTVAFEDFEQYLIENPDSSIKDKVAYFAVSDRTILRWNKKVDWDFILTARRKAYAIDTASIDRALTTRAMTGDVRAIELFYQRFDGWVPTQANINKDASERPSARDVKKALEYLAEEDGKGTGQGDTKPGPSLQAEA